MYLRRLRDLREDHDLTQQEIADLLGCSQVTYSRYETDERHIPLEMLVTLADYYQVTLDYIVGRKTPYKK